MILREEIDDKAVEYIKEVQSFGGELSYGISRHNILINTSQTKVGNYYNKTPNQWDEGKTLAWQLGLMEDVKVDFGCYFRSRISKKGLNVLTQANITIIDEILQERKRQDEKWGEQTHPCLDQTLLNRKGSCTPQRMCENYEIPSENRAKSMCETSFKNGTGTWAHIALEELSEVISEFDIVKRREELIQLTSVCLAWIESIDRQTK